MKNTHLNSNLQFLSRYFPQLSARIDAMHDSNRSIPFEFIAGERGTPTFRVSVDGNWKYLHSRYDPVSEAVRWAQSQPAATGSVVIFVGWGMGYHIIEWIKRYGRTVAAVVVIEPEPIFFQESLAHVDLRPLANTSRMEIVLGSTGQDIYQSLLKFMEPILSGDLAVIPLPFAAIYPATFFNTLKSEIQKLMAAKKQMLEHMAAQGARCQENMIRNLPAVADSLFPHDIHNLASNQPAIIVAAGPSLDRNIDLLNQANNHTWIIAVDTSLRILRQRGIESHLVVTKDPTEHNRRHFDKLENLVSPALAFDPQVSPDIPPRFTGPKVCMPNRNHTVHHYISGLQLQSVDELPLSTNVAVAAFNLAVVMGCNPIIFVGLDLCFSDTQGPSHASGATLSSVTRFSSTEQTILYQRGSAQDTLAIMLVEGIDGKMYPTHTTFYEALRLLESLIQKAPCECIDASEGGARIAGTRIMPLAEALQLYCLNGKRDNVSVSAGVEKTHTRAKTALPLPPLRNKNAIQKSLLDIAAHITQCGQIAKQAQDHSLESAAAAREEIEKDYRLYHELQSALERLMVEISRPNFWDESNSQDVLMERYQWYLSEIARSCELFAPLYAEIADSLSFSRAEMGNSR
ncbi:MAG: DUF115 domain-containing protein [Candidatus Omnitrophota bacterium]|jgi:hypothetical protein|nr:MAG: DUF115 domain-containing protein [Candidatus Omnitrophota bacterium]